MKAILVIDMSDSCNECQLMRYSFHGFFCSANDRCVNSLGFDKPREENDRPSWCPLKPMPEKKEVNLELDYEAYYQIGWNECLEEIEND